MVKLWIERYTTLQWSMPAKCASHAAFLFMRFIPCRRSDHWSSHIHSLLSPSLHGSLTLILGMWLAPAERLSRHYISKAVMCVHAVGFSFLQCCLWPWVEHVLARAWHSWAHPVSANLVQPQPTSEMREQEINAHSYVPSFSLLSFKAHSEMFEFSFCCPDV